MKKYILENYVNFLTKSYHAVFVNSCHLDLPSQSEIMDIPSQSETMNNPSQISSSAVISPSAYDSFTDIWITFV